MHRQKLRKSLWDRLHEKLEPNSNGCWLWTASVKEYGYGIIGLGRRGQGTAKTHRVAWELYNGPIPEGLCILHKCDVPRCCNPDHLYAGTLKQNAQDTVNRGRNFRPNNRAERSSSSKLTIDQVNDIRKKEMTQIKYAKKYNVSRSCVAEIWRGKNWKYD